MAPELKEENKKLPMKDSSFVHINFLVVTMGKSEKQVAKCYFSNSI